MDSGTVAKVLQEAILIVIECSLPMLVTALAIGIIISVFQAATQINEQTLAFVPKIIGVFLALLLSIGYITAQISGFVTRLYEFIAQMGL